MSSSRSILAIASFYSELHEYSDIKKYLDEFHRVVENSGLAKYYHGVFTGDKRANFSAENLVLFGATGGISTAMFESASSARSVYLVYHEEHNSLASILNVASMLKQHGVKTVQLSLDEFSKIAPKLNRSASAAESLRGREIIVLGDLPRWTKKSRAIEFVESQFSVSFKVLDFSHLGDWINRNKSAAEELAREVISGSRSSSIDYESVVKAAAFYHALRELASSTKTRAIAVKCFDMLDMYGVTGCLGLAEFTMKDGIAACEADIHASVVMWVLKEISGRDPWMGNVSHVEPGELELSHCTISRAVVKSYSLTTHFESNLPLGIAGHVEPGLDATIVGYNSQRKLWRVIKGLVLKGEPISARKCRTQVLFKVSPEASKAVVEDPIEGHYVVVFTNVFEEAVLAGELAGLNVQSFKL